MRRQKRFGPNRLAEEQRVTFWAVAREEITEPMILLLLAVGLVYGLAGELLDTIVILFVIAGIFLVEVFNEYRAKAAIASLRHLAAPTAPVIRDGADRQVPVENIVPGDLVVLRPGERVSADLRLVEALGLMIDEASLTGESVPVVKDVVPVPPATELGDRRDMAYAGTLVTTGKGRGVVVATGMATEIGRIVRLVREVREPRTPLQVSMRQLAGWLVWLALGFSVLVPVLGFLFGQPLREMVLTGLTLAFATIPEELPILITIVLGLGALRLSRRQAIIKRLRAAETLGSVSAIASDKTGTITENCMVVSELYVPGDGEGIPFREGAVVPGARQLLEVGLLANDATLNEAEGQHSFAGDPMDVALLAAAGAAGLHPDRLRGAGPVGEFTFDNLRQLMSVVFRRDGRLLVVAKGAPESVLSRCRRWLAGGEERALKTEDRDEVLAVANRMAGRGLRVLGFAYKTMALAGSAESRIQLQAVDDVETDLVFAGLVGFLDPPRPEVPDALRELREAGIRVLMLTGDHPATASAVARAVGIDGGRVLLGREVESLDQAGLEVAVEGVSVYARIAPEDKLRIVRALQSRGEVVAVTGDGVNDAPALKEAAIGVAMGHSGTDVAKEAAGVILGDDNFATIAVAVREGRKLYENLWKAVRYYLAAKVALVGSSLIAVLAHLPVPFAPIQIIVMELFMDLGASVTFTAEPAEGDVMARPPRDPRRPFMDHAMQLGIFVGGLSLCAAVTITYSWAFWQDASPAHAQTVAFATWLTGHVVLALHMRTARQPLSSGGLLSNRAMALWGLAAVAMLAMAMNVPLISAALKTTRLNAEDWLVAIVVPLATTSPWEAWKLWQWRAGRTACSLWLGSRRGGSQ